MVLATALFDKAPFRNCHLPRRRARREQAEALQAPEELSRPGRGVQHLRRRCAALVHGVVAAALRRRSRHAEGRQRDRRDGAPGAAADLERLFVLHALRQHRRHQGQARHHRPRPSSTATSSARRRNWSAPSRRRWTGSTSPAACNALPPFIEALNNWYIRRSRERFWKAEKDADKRAAYDTLYTVLVTLCRTMAPFLPYLTEHIHRALVRWRERASPGLAGCVGVRASIRRWSSAWTSRAPSARRRPRSARRRTCATACRSASSPSRIRAIAILEPLRDVIADEANVKEVVFAADPSAFGVGGAGRQSARRRQAARRRR